MSIELFDPVCEVEVVLRQAESRLDGLHGKRVGFVFNQHISSVAFWRALESEIERELAPQATERIYKTNTWAQAPREEVERLVENSDYLLVGVGA